MKRNDLLLTLLSALLLALSRLPLHLGWLVFFAWLPLLRVFERGQASSRDLLRMGFVMSLVYCAIVFYWLVYVNPGAILGVTLVYIFAYYLVFYGINRIFRTLPRWRWLGFLSILITFEYIQNFGETRFPWFNQGYSLAEYPLLIQAADLIGIVGLSALVICVNLLLHQLWPSLPKWLPGRTKPFANRPEAFGRKQGRALTALVLLFVVWIGYGWHCQRDLELEKHEAGIFAMQPSILQDLKWEPEQYDASLATFRDLTLQAAADSARLVIWPEGAMIGDLDGVSRARRDLRAVVDTARVDIFTGFQHYVYDPAHPMKTRSYNTASLYQPTNFDNVLYFKNILVPVGERMLWLHLFPFLWKVNLGQANWEFGTELAWYESGGYRFSPSICYELAFPGIFHRMAIPRDTLGGGFAKSDYLVNITNDAWFGTSYGPWLHAVMARFRAVENRIQIYRSANTGISLIVDPKGRVLQQTGLFEVGNITAPLYTTPKIPLIRRIHRYPFLFVAIAAILALLARIRKPRGTK
ncbi:MAG: apolipoprotein N-acyltransferase [Candidatus Cloacimonetes bacterium]|nr:apolipoprotein N-acyltransferase [Candidatus Cloacimonadota bacterium]